jgi:hypothetical protein
LEGLRKITKLRIASVLAKIHAKNLPHTSLECYCHTNPV